MVSAPPDAPAAAAVPAFGCSTALAPPGAPAVAAVPVLRCSSTRAPFAAAAGAPAPVFRCSTVRAPLAAAAAAAVPVFGCSVARAPPGAPTPAPVPALTCSPALAPPGAPVPAPVPALVDTTPSGTATISAPSPPKFVLAPAVWVGATAPDAARTPYIHTSWVAPNTNSAGAPADVGGVPEVLTPLPKYSSPAAAAVRLGQARVVTAPASAPPDCAPSNCHVHATPLLNSCAVKFCVFADGSAE